MKSVAYFVGAGVAFVLLVALFVTQTNKPNLAIAATPETPAASIEVDSVMQFPVSFTFIRPEGKPTALFAPVKFNHFDHQTVSCTTCHHTWDGSSEVESCSTDGCHSDMVNRGEVTSYFHAFHTRESETSCRGCHMKRTLAGESNLPTSPCGNNICHPRDRRIQ